MYQPIHFSLSITLAVGSLTIIATMDDHLNIHTVETNLLHQSNPHISDFDCGPAVDHDSDVDLNLFEIPPPQYNNLRCTWEQFLELESPAVGYYDYDDGVVLWNSQMANSGHQRLTMAYSIVIECKEDEHLLVRQEPSVQLVHSNGSNNLTVWTVAQNHTVEQANLPVSSRTRSRHRGRTPHQTLSSSSATTTAPSSSTAPSSVDQPLPQILYSLRHPDYCGERAKHAQDQIESETTRDSNHVAKIMYAHPLTKRIRFFGEVSSDTTRMVDMRSKWRAYATSGVPFYFIHDRGTTTRVRSRLIVGSLTFIEGSSRSAYGDRHLSPPAGTETRYYYRRVFDHDQIVTIPPFSHLNITAGQLLDPDYMDELAARLDNERRSQRELAEQQKQRADTALQRANRLDNERRRESQRANRESERSGRLTDFIRSLGFSPPSSPPDSSTSQVNVVSRNRSTSPPHEQSHDQSSRQDRNRQSSSQQNNHPLSLSSLLHEEGQTTSRRDGHRYQNDERQERVDGYSNSRDRQSRRARRGRQASKRSDSRDRLRGHQPDRVRPETNQPSSRVNRREPTDGGSTEFERASEQPLRRPQRRRRRE